ELAHVALGIPFLHVGIRPQLHRVRIQVIKRSLHHAAIEQQPLDFLPLPRSALVGWLAVNLEHCAMHADNGFAKRMLRTCILSLSADRSEQDHKSQGTEKK